MIRIFEKLKQNRRQSPKLKKKYSTEVPNLLILQNELSYNLKCKKNTESKIRRLKKPADRKVSVKVCKVQ